MNIDIGKIQQEAYYDGYRDALRDLYHTIVNNEDLPTKTNQHYLDGRIDKQNIVLGIIETMLEHTDKLDIIQVRSEIMGEDCSCTDMDCENCRQYWGEDSI